MAIDTTKTIISVGVGVIDEVLERNDATEHRTEPFRTATDIGRLVLAGIGYATQLWMPRYASMGEALALSATPLLVKSIAKPVMAAVEQKTTSTFVPRTMVPGRSTKPEFGDVKLV
jgi:hypothetical protein